jgi:small subunit ribosomal protein S17
MAEQERQTIPEAPAFPAGVAQPTSSAPATGRGSRKVRTGEVIASAMNKTIVVRSVTRVPHARFGKIVKQEKKFYAHDEENKAKTGDTVRIMETRPISKLKRWRLVEVLRK